MSMFSLTVGFVLLLFALILYLMALFQVPQNLKHPIDRVTTAQALVVLWLLIAVCDNVYFRTDKPQGKNWWFHSNVHRVLSA